MEDRKEVALDDLTPLKYANIKDRRDYYHESVMKQTCENIAEDPNAKLSSDTGFITVSYHPKDHDICSQYEKQSTIYELPLSPSIITLTKCQETGRVSPQEGWDGLDSSQKLRN